MARPTLDTVAAACGVSRMTVSNAYNRPDQLSPETRERVLRTARELGYPGPNAAARTLRRGQARTVGVVLTEQLSYAFSDPGRLQFLHGLAEGLSRAGNALLLLSAEPGAAQPLVRDAVVDAFVLCSLRKDDPVVAEVLGRRLPVVTAGTPQLAGVPFVGIDQARAASVAARHLVELGHRRLAAVGLSPRPGPVADVGPGVRLALRRRLDNFRRAARDAGCDEPAAVDAVGNSRPAGEAAARVLLDARAADRPSALFAVTDLLALGVLDAAAALGIAVPQELSVMGFDDIPEAARAVPPLTTVSQLLQEQGRVAAEIALELVAGHHVAGRRVALHLVVRSSTDRPLVA